MADLLDKISNDLNLPKALLESALGSAGHKFRKIIFKKRNGGKRVAIQPAAELKPILAWIDTVIFSKLPVSSIAMAFLPGTSIVKNAKAHRDSLFSVRVDLENFFGSITSGDLDATIKECSGIVPDWVKLATTTKVIQKACFDKDDRLPIGYLTSPRIANAVMFGFDNALLDIIPDKSKFGNAVVTRYADDFVFSTDKRGACRIFVNTFEELLNTWTSPNLKINATKTRYMSRAGGSMLITGLRVKQDGEIGVHPNYRDHVRLLLKLYANAKLKSDDVVRLNGHLAFVQFADPQLFTRLSFKYSNEIASVRSSNK